MTVARIARGGFVLKKVHGRKERVDGRASVHLVVGRVEGYRRTGSADARALDGFRAEQVLVLGAHGEVAQSRNGFLFGRHGAAGYVALSASHASDGPVFGGVWRRWGDGRFG